MGISRKCVSHWITRYETEDETDLHDGFSRPRSTLTRTLEALEQQVLTL